MTDDRNDATGRPPIRSVTATLMANLPAMLLFSLFASSG